MDISILYIYFFVRTSEGSLSHLNTASGGRGVVAEPATVFLVDDVEAAHVRQVQPHLCHAPKTPLSLSLSLSLSFSFLSRCLSICVGVERLRLWITEVLLQLLQRVGHGRQHLPRLHHRTLLSGSFTLAFIVDVCLTISIAGSVPLTFCRHKHIHKHKYTQYAHTNTHTCT